MHSHHYRSAVSSSPNVAAPVHAVAAWRSLCANAVALVTLLAAALLVSPSVADSSTCCAAARAARTFRLDESGSLHLTSKHGFLLNEQGTASGTVKGTIYVHLKIVSSKRVTAEVNIYPRGGSITGFGTAKYQREHTSASFSGTMAVERGTGSYGRAHGSGLGFSGTIQRSNEAVTVHVSGRVSD
jgi:hypothetical protein